MRVLRRISTPWPAYSVTFTRDGSRLAVGGGTWYGSGGLLLTNLASSDIRVWPTSELLYDSDAAQEWSPTVSGVFFSDGDRYLAASMWSARQSYAPSVLLEATGLHARLRWRFVHHFGPGRSPCPTGIVGHRNFIITRNHHIGGDRIVQIVVPDAVDDPDDVISVDEIPAAFHVRTDERSRHHTHSRLIVTRGCVITETGGSRGTYVPNSGGGYTRRIVPEGLLVRPLSGAPDAVIPIAGCGRVTAISELEEDRLFVTGGRNGELDRWHWDGAWRQQRLQDAQAPRRIHWPSLPRPSWVTYRPASIVGVARLADSPRWASVTAGGEIVLWRHDRPELVWQLPVPGSPRALAAHPQENWLAVGLKCGGFDAPESVVLLIEAGD